MYSQWSTICFLQFLISLNINALTVIPVARQVIKANGSTRTISKVLIPPEDDLENHTSLDDNEYFTEFLRAFSDKENNNVPKRKIDRYKIYVNRKYRHSKPLLKPTASSTNEKGRSETNKQRYLINMTSFHPNTVHHYYKKVVTEGAGVDNTQKGVSAKTAVLISNKLQQEAESREASKDSVSEEVAAGGFGTERNKAQSVNKTEEIKHLETVAAYGDLTKPLNYVKIYQAPGAIDKSGTTTTLLQKTQIDHLNEKLPVHINGNMHTIHKKELKNQEEQSNSDQEDTELHKPDVTYEINPLNIQTHNLLQSNEVSQSQDTFSDDLAVQNVDQTRLLIDHSEDQGHPLRRDLVFQRSPLLSAYNNNDNKNLKLNPLNNYFHPIQGYDNIIDDQIPRAGTSQTITSSYSYSGSPYSTYIQPVRVDRSIFSGNVPHVNYAITSASPQSYQEFMELQQNLRRPHKHNWIKIHKLFGNAQVPNNPYYSIDTNGIPIETIKENLKYPGSNKIDKQSQLCPECFHRLYAEFPQQESKKEYLGGPPESNEYLHQLLKKDSALLSHLQSPKQNQHYDKILQLLQSNPVKVDSDFTNQDQPSQILPIDTSPGDIYIKETLHLPFRPVSQKLKHRPAGYINKEQRYILSNYNNERQTYGPDSGYIDYEEIRSPFDYMYQKQLQKSYLNHEKIHSFPDYIHRAYIGNQTLIPSKRDHIDQKETNINPETDDNLATTLYITLKQHKRDLQPIPNIHLFTIANLQKYLNKFERIPKLNENVQGFKLYKIIKLLTTIYKARVNENDPSGEYRWFTRLTPIKKYRIEKHVYNLLKETWFQGILIDLDKNNYNLNILKEYKRASPLTDWKIPVNVFDTDHFDDDIENNSYDYHEKVSSNTDQEHDLTVLKPQWRSGVSDGSSGDSGVHVPANSLGTVANFSDRERLHRKCNI